MAKFLQPVICIILFLYGNNLFAQGIGINNPTPAASSVLDLTSTNKGLLVPRIALTATNAATPVTAPATSLLVFNTATAGTAPNNVTPGYYFWDGAKWVRLKVSADNTDWGTTGNAGTNAATNFIGTTDNQDVVLKRNNVRAGLLGLTNTSWGALALNSNTTGARNTAVGDSSLFSNSNGVSNTAIGANALQLNTTGFNNTAIGQRALQSNIDGDNNNAFGQLALGTNTTGGGNTAIGDSALFLNIAGSNNTALGARAGVFSGSLVNATAIGSRATIDTSNGIVLGSILGINGATANTRVGIGTQRPGFGLHVVNSTPSTGGDKRGIAVENTNTGEAAISFINSVTTADVNRRWIVGLGSAQDKRLTFTYGNSMNVNDLVMSLTSDGSVGIRCINNAALNGRLHVHGAYAATLQTFAQANITLNINSHTAVISTAVPGQFVTLPAANTCDERMYIIVNQTNTACGITTYKSFTNSNATTIAPNSSLTVQSDGTNWIRIN